jgi:hypothetical protein
MRKIALLALASGCMLTPFDGQSFPILDQAVQFSGYSNIPNDLISVSAPNGVGHMIPIGSTHTATTATFTTSDGYPGYQWSFSASIPRAVWLTSTTSTSSPVTTLATVHATRSSDSQNLSSVNSNAVSCYEANPSASNFFSNCTAPHSPNAVLHGPTTPHIDWTIPADQLIADGRGSSLNMWGWLLARPDTHVETLEQDIQFFWRQTSPTVTAWTAFDGWDCNSSACGWSPETLGIAVGPAQIGQVGSVHQFKLVVRGAGESNVLTFATVAPSP